MSEEQTEAPTTEEAQHSPPGGPMTGHAITQDGSQEPEKQVSGEAVEAPKLYVEGEDKPPADEPPAEPEKAAAEPEKKVSKEWAALARKDKALREREQRVKSTEEQLTQIQEIARRVQEDPMAVAELFGQDIYDRMTMKLYEQGGGKVPEKTAEQQMLERLESIEKRIEDREKELTSAREQAEQSKKSQARESAINTVISAATSNPAKYKRINRLGSDEVRDLVWSTAQELSSSRGGNFTDDQVLDAVEYRLTEAYKRLAIEDAAAAPAPVVSEPGPSRPITRTLTNRNSAGGSVDVSNGEKLPLDSDKRNHAILEKVRLWD